VQGNLVCNSGLIFYCHPLSVNCVLHSGRTTVAKYLLPYYLELPCLEVNCQDFANFTQFKDCVNSVVGNSESFLMLDNFEGQL
jgi:hypothetical protein